MSAKRKISTVPVEKKMTPPQVQETLKVATEVPKTNTPIVDESNIRDWVNDPQTALEWIAVFMIENVDVPRLTFFYKWLATRSNSEEILDQITALIGAKNKKMKTLLLAYSKRSKAIARLSAYDKIGAQELVQSITPTIINMTQEITDELDRNDIVANSPDGVRT